VNQLVNVPMFSLCDIKSGKSNTRDADDNGEYTFFDRSKIIKKSSRYLYDCEALIIAGEGSVFLPKHYKGKFDLHQRAYALHNFKPSINVKYLYYYLHHLKDYLPSVAVGATVKSLRRRHFENLPVVIFPIKTQQKIVAKLDRIFAEIDKANVVAEANAKNAEELFKSFLHNVFKKIDNHNKPIKLSEIIKLEYGKGLKESDRDLNGIYGVYGANGIKSKTNRFLYNKPSIVVGRKGSAGELTIVTEKFWALDVTYYVIHDDKKTDLYFLYYALKTLNISSLAKGIKPGINRNHVYNLLITIPNINEQKLIVKKILNCSNNLNLVINSYKKRKIEFQFLKQAILKQAFNGELVKAG
jgi:type I restriction enzyme S subunit